ncbi:MAG TPA: 16S rRNA (cytidine(1402)-2'-O)-methyltransferase [Acidobacteriota bacterium]|nr:16S rRNA (cytidine(1402)-2'-O)-methyltransferase [Acidobacteriota bacterium]
MLGTLYVVATPIGNLKDITLRALEVLKSVDCVACEDTRVTSKLLNRYGIPKPLISYHEHNERRRAKELIERLQRGESVALVSDAGTPALSDPGAHLVAGAASQGITCVPVPGPSAFPALLAVSGWETDRVVFAGFPPSRASEKQRFLTTITEPGIYCFFESPHRILSLLRQLDKLWNRPQIVLGRELTKMHEEILRGSAAELGRILAERERIRGEFVLLVRKPEEHQAIRSGGSLQQEYERLLKSGVDRKKALKILAKEHGLSRKEIYSRLMKKESN